MKTNKLQWVKGNNQASIVILILMLLYVSGCGKSRQTASETIIAPPPPGLESEQAVTKPALVRLTQKQASDLKIQHIVVDKGVFRYVITVPGLVRAAPGHISIVSAPVNGRVVKIYAHEGENVKKGSALLELESLEFANIGADYLQAYAEARFQEQQMKRLKVLVEKKISPQRTLEKTEMDYARALSAERAALARLNALGVQQEQIEKWRTGVESKPVLRFYAPIDGTIDEHLIERGQSVNAYEKMLSIINTKVVLIHGFVPPDDATFLNPGDSLIVYPQKNREMSIRAAITTINPALDPKNKSKVINIIANSTKKWPIPGQNVQIDVYSKLPNPVISIPLSAVEYEGSNATVFIQTEPLIYEKRFIKIGRVANNMAVVDSGLVRNDKVAVSQVFALKALSRFEEFSD